MSRWFMEDGTNIPVTVIEAGPCVVTQVKTEDRDGYAGVQYGFEDAKPRTTPMPQIGHDAKAGTGPKKHHREFRGIIDLPILLVFKSNACPVGTTAFIRATKRTCRCLRRRNKL